MSEPTGSCTILRGVTVDARVIAEFSVKLTCACSHCQRRWWEYARWDKATGRHVEGSAEDLVRCLEEKCKEFKEFLRDHRSQDMVSLSVERVKADQCSACGATWKAHEEEGQVFCASCGRILAPEEPALKGA
jgi:hypothetical protein